MMTFSASIRALVAFCCVGFAACVFTVDEQPTPVGDTGDTVIADVVADVIADVVADVGEDGGEEDGGVTGACCNNGSFCSDNVEESACSADFNVFEAGRTCDDAICFPTCRTYCAEYQEACSGDDFFLGDSDWCNEFCTEHSGWPTGVIDDQSGNSIGCRIYHSQRAQEATGASRISHCNHAGETGFETCGSNCENYCTLSTSICTGDDANFADFEDCAEQCRDLNDDGEIGDTSGDSIQCRMYHLGLAAQTRITASHCGHGGIESTPGTCGAAE
ncbi:MAG: hypothetical protein ACI81R_001742 [Bradymonadia bacterium]|jgi:hypothetical protein